MVFMGKLKRLYDIVGEDKFLKIVDELPGKLYIPQRQTIIREMLVKNADEFLEELNKSNSKQEAAKKFNVSERTIHNWLHMAVSAKAKGECVRGGNKLARAVL